MSSPSITKSVVETEVSSGTVRATVLVPARPERLWDAITRRETVSMWFGDLSADMAPGKSTRLDFGDGDFFVIDKVRASHPNKLEYSWRFLGTGPQDFIMWEVTDQGEKCVLTVTDYEPSRTQKSGEELAEGWTDFLERLEKYLRTGDLTRYDWRRDFDGSIELPVTKAEAEQVLSVHRGRFLWKPLDTVLSSEPLEVSAMQWKSADCIEFQVKAESWKHATACRLEIVPKPHGSALVIRHTGWAEIGEDPVFCMTERRRFSDKWIGALKETRARLGPTIQ